MVHSLCGFVVFSTRRFVLSHALLFVLVFFFSVLLSIVITSHGEEGAGLCASRAFVCVFCTRQFLSVFSSFCSQACDSGTPWTFSLTFHT